MLVFSTEQLPINNTELINSCKQKIRVVKYNNQILKEFNKDTVPTKIS